MATKRKGISKKVRFEIFKRDGFKCCYCGETPPSVTLEVDHIEPVSKGGSNDMNNLVTACFSCNRGKTNIQLDKLPATLVENMEILKAQEEQLKEYRKFVKKIQRREKKDIEDVAKIYSEAVSEYVLSAHFKNNSLKQFLKKLPKHEVEEAMEFATTKIEDSSKMINYFCGICWTKIRGEKK